MGRGGTSEVRRVWDSLLGRSAAIKFPLFPTSSGLLERFHAEARVTATLAHPGVPPVYDLGELPDGRPYFLMAEVSGQSLDQAGPRLPLRRKVDVFARLCEPVAFAHQRGILHGDLKPANVMIGAFGEVQLVDWGSASVNEGTPAYLAPERARGAPASVATDVYSLGALLLELLTGIPPFAGLEEAEILDALRAGELPPCEGELPGELREWVEAATHPDPQERPASVRELIGRVNAWLDQEDRRERALGLVGEALRRLDEEQAALVEADALEAEAEAILFGIPAWAEVATKEGGWALQSRAATLRREAGLAQAKGVQLLRESLSLDPTCREAHRRLSEHYVAALKDAETRREPEEAERLAVLVRAHGGRRFSRWLEGGGFVSLHTEPTGAQVEVRVLEPVGRRLREWSLGIFGSTPLCEVPLAMGSYVLILRHPECEEQRYPVQIRRMEHWDGVPPGERLPRPIRLPRRGELPPDCVVVPAGWTTIGRDRQALFVHPGARIWVDSFVMDRRPLSNRQMLAMLDRLEGEGRGEEIHLPRAKAGAAHYARGNSGWERVPDGDGDLWGLDWPVFSVDWWDAVAVAGWRAGWEGRPWRLPSEWEREKAARGVDGRFFPWGDSFDPGFCWMRESHRGRPLPRDVEEEGLDLSPYGASGLAGNIRDWCWEKAGQEAEIVEGGRLVLPPLDSESRDPRMIRGGSWLSPPAAVRSASRQNARPTERSEAIGMRHVFSWG